MFSLQNPQVKNLVGGSNTCLTPSSLNRLQKGLSQMWLTMFFLNSWVELRTQHWQCASPTTPKLGGYLGALSFPSWSMIIKNSARSSKIHQRFIKDSSKIHQRFIKDSSKILWQLLCVWWLLMHSYGVRGHNHSSMGGSSILWWEVEGPRAIPKVARGSNLSTTKQMEDFLLSFVDHIWKSFERWIVGFLNW